MFVFWVIMTCVRLASARLLVQWLLGSVPNRNALAALQRLKLASPADSKFGGSCAAPTAAQCLGRFDSSDPKMPRVTETRALVFKS